MQFEKLFSAEFTQRLNQVAAERRTTPLEVLDSWVIQTQLLTPIARWERDAQSLGDTQQLGLFTLNIPSEDMRVLMGLAFLASTTGNAPSALLPAPEPAAVAAAAQTQPASPQMVDLLDTVETLLEETLARGTWTEEGFDKAELANTLHDFFSAVRKQFGI